VTFTLGLTLSIVTGDNLLLLLMESTTSVEDENAFKLRSYQQEMVDLSLKENIIVAIDTGGGKTAIAVARVEAELQSCDPDKVFNID